jgi:hypothetical protein
MLFRLKVAASAKRNRARLTKMWMEAAVKKRQVFFFAMEMYRGSSEFTNGPGPAQPLKIRIDAMLAQKPERNGRTTSRKIAMSHAVFRSATIKHLHHNLEMKFYHLQSFATPGS